MAYKSPPTNRGTLIALLFAPFIFIGWPLGFIWEAISIGFNGGKDAVMNLCMSLKNDHTP